MQILDLGCGTAKVKGAVGIDKISLPGIDLLGDIARFPYPFANNTFDCVYLNDVIEHIPDTIGAMEEVYRISKPDAKIYIRVVNWNHRYASMDPTHVKFFTENSFDFFGKREGRSYYTQARFDIVSVTYGFDQRAQRWIRNKKILKFLSDYLCNILQGLYFELRTVK